MSKTVERVPRIAILDSPRAKYRRLTAKNVVVCETAHEIVQVYDEHPANLMWISCKTKLTDELVKAAAQRSTTERQLGPRKGETLVAVGSARPESGPMLHGLFARTVGESQQNRWLSQEELIEALTTPDVNRSELFVAAAADPVTKMVSLLRGDLQQIVVPFSRFPPSGDGVEPDFSQPTVTDYGRTVAFGEYEASADAILYETDPAYRKRVQQRRRAAERTFGASLLRLRKQRQLKRTDFAPLSAKTIARLERNEIEKPHGTTLRVLSRKLGVMPDDIESY